MHKLNEKRGRKTVVHHFHHVAEKDGTKKHVYLGTDPERAKERLTKLQVEMIHSDNKLVKDLETVQAKLARLGHYSRSYDDKLADIRQRYYRQKHAENLLSKGTKTALPFFTYIIIFVDILAFGYAFYFFSKNPDITGAAVQGITNIAANKIVSAAFGILIIVIILGLVLHYVDHKHKHRYDKYKPPVR